LGLRLPVTLGVALLALGCAQRDGEHGATGHVPQPATVFRAPLLRSERDSVCRALPQGDDCEQAVERFLLSQARLPVRRRGPDLLIRATSGRLVVLHDSIVDGPATVVHLYAGYVAPLRAHLVRLGYYEGGGWELVNAASGARMPVAGPPTPSPDSSHFVAISSDLVSQFDPTGIEVWRATPDSAIAESWLNLEASDWGPTSATWIGNDSIRITTEVLDAGTEEVTPGSPVMVVRAKDGWKLLGPPR